MVERGKGIWGRRLEAPWRIRLECGGGKRSDVDSRGASTEALVETTGEISPVLLFFVEMEVTCS